MTNGRGSDCIKLTYGLFFLALVLPSSPMFLVYPIHSTHSPEGNDVVGCPAEDEDADDDDRHLQSSSPRAVQNAGSRAPEAVSCEME